MFLVVCVQNTFAASVGYLVPASDALQSCTARISDAVAKVAAPALLKEIKYYKSGTTAKPPFHSCCGIEKWPLFDTKDYSSDNIEFDELPIVPENTNNNGDYASATINADKSVTIKLLSIVAAKVPESAVGFTYTVTSTFTAIPSSVGLMVKFSNQMPTSEECVGNITMIGYKTK